MVTRKSVKILIMFACGIGLVLGLSGCKKNGEPPEDQTPGSEVPTKTATVDVSPPSEQTLAIVPLQGLGPVAFGMSENEVIALLGQPDRTEGGIGLFYLKSRGVSLLLHPRRGVSEISCWSKKYPGPGTPEMTTFTGKTKEGIGMGASREQVVAAYGEPDRTDSKDPLEILYYGKLGTQFWLAQNNLVSIKMRGR